MLLNIQQPKRKQAISLTPLIDVVFILLLFFMLSSSFIQWRQIKLPASTEAEKTSNELVIVSLLSGGELFSFEGKQHKVSDMNSLMALVNQNPDAVYALEVEKQVTTQALIRLLDNLKLAGAKQVSLAGVLH